MRGKSWFCPADKNKVEIWHLNIVEGGQIKAWGEIKVCPNPSPATAFLGAYTKTDRAQLASERLQNMGGRGGGSLNEGGRPQTSNLL